MSSWIVREGHAPSSSCCTKMAQCHFSKAPDGAFIGVCAWAIRMSLSSPCQIGGTELPLPLAPTLRARARVHSLFYISSPASPSCLARWLSVEEKSCHSGSWLQDREVRTDKSQQTASVFTMVGLEAAGIFNVLEDSWLANAPRLLSRCHLNEHPISSVSKVNASS